MKKRIMFALLAAAMLVAGAVLYFSFNQEASPHLKTDPDQLQKNSTNEKSKDQNASKHAERDRTAKGMVQNQLKESKEVFSPDDQRVIALGDSLTQGVGDSTNSGGYVGILDRTFNKNEASIQFDNFGHAGDRTDQLLKRIEDPKISASIHDADVILMTIGANDIMKVLKDNVSDLQYEDFANEQGKYEKRLRRVFSELRKMNPKADIYLLGFYNPFGEYFHDIPELDKIVNTWNSASKKTAESFKHVHYIPTKDLFDQSTDQLLYKDNFHPNNQGYQKIADRVLDYLNRQ